MEVFVFFFVFVGPFVWFVFFCFFGPLSFVVFSRTCFKLKTQISTLGAQHMHVCVESMQKGLLAESKTSQTSPEAMQTNLSSRYKGRSHQTSPEAMSTSISKRYRPPFSIPHNSPF